MVIFVDENNKKFQLDIRLTNYEFLDNLLDETSSEYKDLRRKLESSVTKLMYCLKFPSFKLNLSTLSTAGVTCMILF